VELLERGQLDGLADGGIRGGKTPRCRQKIIFLALLRVIQHLVKNE